MVSLPDAQAVALSMKIIMYHLFSDMLQSIPDWSKFSEGVPLLPTRAGEVQDFRHLCTLRDMQAQFMDFILKKKEENFAASTDLDQMQLTTFFRQDNTWTGC